MSSNTVLKLKKKNGPRVWVQVKDDLRVQFYTQEHRLIIERLKSEGSALQVTEDLRTLHENKVQNLGWVSIYSSQDADKTSDVLLDLSNKYDKPLPALISQFFSRAEGQEEWDTVLHTFLSQFANTYMGFLLPSFGVDGYVTFIYRQDSAELKNNQLVAGFKPQSIQKHLIDGDFGVTKEDVADYTIGVIGLNVNAESPYRTTAAKLLFYVFHPVDEDKDVLLVPVVRFGSHIANYLEENQVEYVTNSNELPEKILGVCVTIDQAYEVMRDFVQDLQNMFFETVFPFLTEEDE